MAQGVPKKLLRRESEPTTPGHDPARYADLYRVARQLRDRGLRTIGLAPVDDRVATATTAIDLAVALADAAAANVAFCDPHGRLAVSDLPGEPMGTHRVVVLREGVVVLTPHGERSGSAAAIGPVLAEATQRFDFVIVDLSGFDARGEHRLAYDMVDAVALVARAGATREHALRDRHRELPEDRDLGVLLVH